MKKLLLVVALCLCFTGCSSDDEEKKDDKVERTEDKEDKVVEKEEPKENIGPFEIQLGSGNYAADVDFPAGTYDIVVVSGTGNVSSSNMYDGGLNETMGISDNSMYTPSFNNAVFDSDTILKVSNGVVIKLTSSAVNLDNIHPRTPRQDLAITLTSGNYTAGVDFDAGIYNVVAVSGTGNVSSSNMFDGGLNAIMGIGDPSFYETEYKNIVFGDGDTLKVTDVEIQLVPVE